MTWTERYLAELEDPDMIGTSEYRTVYDHVQTVIESAKIGGDDPREMVDVTLDQLLLEVQDFKQASTRARRAEVAGA